MCAPSPRSWRGAVTASLVVAPSSLARARARRRASPPARATRAAGAEASHGAGRRRGAAAAARARPGRAAARRHAHARATLFERPRSTSATSTSRSRRASPRRAAHLARAERRLVPRADRADRRDAGRAQGRAARLRPPRRTERELRGDGRLMARLFPGDYEVVAPGRRLRGAARGRRRRSGSPSSRTRSAPRCACSSARCAGWTPRCHGTRVVRTALGPSSTPLRADLRERVRYVDAASARGAARRRRVVRRGLGRRRAGAGAVCARAAAGAVPVASRLPSTRRCCATARPGCSSSPRRRHARRAARAPDRRRRPARAAARAGRAPRPWNAVADEFEALYARDRRRAATTPRGDPPMRARLAEPPRHRRRPAHAHRPQPRLRDAGRGAARRRRASRASGAIAVTDHNEVSGAIDAQAKAAEYGVKVIVAEEVKTADQGEVIGLFLTRRSRAG